MKGVKRQDFGDHLHPLWVWAQKNDQTIAQVAKKLGLSREYCAQIMHRWRAPGRDLILKMVDIFGFSAEELLSVPVRKPKKRKTK